MYLDLYIERWGREHPAAVLARVPGAFTWDDHDIFDGWGSYQKSSQEPNLFQQVYGAAALAFEAFQLGTSPTLGGSASVHLKENGGKTGQADHYLQILTFESKTKQQQLTILLLDGRSGRTMETVLSDQQWSDLKQWLKAVRKPTKVKHHLLIVSSMPVVYMKFDAALRTLELLPGAQNLEDDMRDHWSSKRHRGERSRLIMNLLEFGQRPHSQITILSGDVHIGARGRVISHDPAHLPRGKTEVTMEQIISSGIVYPSPNRFEFGAVLATGTESVDEIAPNVIAQVVPLSGSSKFLRARSFLSIRADRTDPRFSLWFKYIAEGLEVEE